MGRIVVVGSGASGVHFALSLLKKGRDVLMLDVGHTQSAPPRDGDGLNVLKRELDDPVAYFLGPRFEAVTFGDAKSDFYSFPPSKRFVFSEPPRMKFAARGFEPLVSFARGGLGEVWTSGVYPFNDDELADFPFGYDDIRPHYEEIARRIGVTGEADDLARFMPVHGDMLPPLRLDAHSRELLAAYARRKETLESKYGCYLGRSRVAVLTEPKPGRRQCEYLGRCIWGCPNGAFYTPSITLEECLQHPNFTYVPQMHVSHFKCDGTGRVTRVFAQPLDGGATQEFPVEKLALAAGTMCTARIFLESIFRDTGETAELHGLMDNRQILAPFIKPSMIGQSYDPESYQYHLLAMGLRGDEPKDYIHGQITCLTTALVHPIIQKIPLDLRTAVFVFRNARAGLGLLNVNFRDTRREGNAITLEPDGNGGRSLVVNYTAEPSEKRRIRQAMRRARKALRRLGCLVAPGAVRIRAKGASVHYAGTLPMSNERRRFTTSKYGESHDFENLYIVDGSTFPFLPAKNITFTLMANAVRIADMAF
ncbi:MAG: GMC family oxidoreductase [Planctomycetes bacterium]|nr:GMC family oxidoreductase [Planctomycetota bacterium]